MITDTIHTYVVLKHDINWWNVGLSSGRFSNVTLGETSSTGTSVTMCRLLNSSRSIRGATHRYNVTTYTLDNRIVKKIASKTIWSQRF